MNLTEHNSRPGGGSGAASSVVATPSQDTGHTPDPHLDPTGHIPAYALLVRTGPGRLNRRLYLSLPAAVKAAERAQGRGHAAALELVRLVPLDGAQGVSADA